MVGGVVCGLSRLSAMHPPVRFSACRRRPVGIGAIVLITMARSSGSVELQEDSSLDKVGGGGPTTVGLWSAIIDLSKDNP